MQRDALNNVHIRGEQVLVSPAELKAAIAVSEQALAQIAKARQTIADVICGQDDRLLVVCGPCSIHDIEAAKAYATRLKALHDAYQDRLYIVMRVYFEKPRTTVGWKGLINDPHLDGSFALETGLRLARELLVWLAELGMPVATEALDPISPQYLAELFAWSAIGARTTESQTHRELASGLSMPVGFKNGTDGSLSTAINALQAASQPHCFMGINQSGQVAVLQTEGNPHGHVILRGGSTPNYDESSVNDALQSLQKAGLNEAIMIDCSHANSGKDHRRQPMVARDVLRQRQNGNGAIMGVMLESNLVEGAQSGGPRESLVYGQSITDACMGWDTTAHLLEELHGGMQQVEVAS
ncbi:3-deoxy-7-phosphoheptulonate synthase [Gallaecimonas pentaromativorans]|uniref:Phospho-2-dehydro-3-deoxyheptonate aldolase n=1 Tax=Gallaecimonas pentaromativorans TaxID=584787 RepID=A0A3N1PHC8_9GAMM|nr:3-deoxy-7-phosphoheptulonate synthase [Gallaecimonas pentaromativorans]MED5525481.1 3-deoxy-7-phosphoheptulonate synthase [Pseudomonadota bacterium]ROQ27469.1 3-deoxy-D-arabinoheptulosonate-7-phosphate synthase [Gallaecimonas pentaromativorans]